MPGTKGSMGVLTGTSKSSHEDVLRECNQMKLEHDDRADRAVRAVTMLREKFDWKVRVEVEEEEPEELDWDPRVQQLVAAPEEDTDSDDSASPGPGGEADIGEDGDRSKGAGDVSNDSEEEKEMENALVIDGAVGSSPMQMTVDL